jgi:hypothetical protein
MLHPAILTFFTLIQYLSPLFSWFLVFDIGGGWVVENRSREPQLTAARITLCAVLTHR